MIKSIRHKGLKRLWEKGQKSGLPPQQIPRITRMLSVLHNASAVEDLNLPGYYLHPLKGQDKGRYSIRVTGNYRLTFEFKDGDAYVLDHEDYH